MRREADAEARDVERAAPSPSCTRANANFARVAFAVDEPDSSWVDLVRLWREHTRRRGGACPRPRASRGDKPPALRIRRGRFQVHLARGLERTLRYQEGVFPQQPAEKPLTLSAFRTPSPALAGHSESLSKGAWFDRPTMSGFDRLTMSFSKGAAWFPSAPLKAGSRLIMSGSLTPFSAAC